jgi:hypothetical protein
MHVSNQEEPRKGVTYDPAGACTPGSRSRSPRRGSGWGWDDWSFPGFPPRAINRSPLSKLPATRGAWLGRIRVRILHGSRGRGRCLEVTWGDLGAPSSVVARTRTPGGEALSSASSWATRGAWLRSSGQTRLRSRTRFARVSPFGGAGCSAGCCSFLSHLGLLRFLLQKSLYLL